MTFETPDDVLEHFGVKGMKWGVRKAWSGAKATGRFARRHPKSTTAVAAGAAFAAKMMSGRDGNRLVSVALPGATMTGADGTVFSMYGPGTPDIRRVRVRDIASLNERYGAIRRGG